MGIGPWFAAGGTGIDTAMDYRDQPEIAAVLAATKKPRDSYFITSKIPSRTSQPLTAACERNRPPLSLSPATSRSRCCADALKAVQEDVKELKVKQLDLVLVHHPAKTDAENIALWQGMEQALAQNLTRSIGLSNFNVAQITALLKVAKVPPAVNQARTIPPPSAIRRRHDSGVRFAQCDLSVGGQDTQCGPRDAAIAFNQAHNITYEAWSPMKHCPFTDPTITKIATAHKVTLTVLLLLLLLFLLLHLVLVLLLLALVLILVLAHLSGSPVASLDSRQG